MTQPVRSLRARVAKRSRPMLRPLLLGACSAVMIGAAVPGQGQDAPTATALLADSVSFDGTQLIASGSVEVIQGETRLTASRIIYDQSTGLLDIEGPLRLTSADGNTVILASAAELDDDLRRGLLTSAQLVIERQLQLAAARIDLVDGRYLRLEKTVASTCEVCVNRPVPLWEIRAAEVIHDSEERQIYFTNAHLRVMDVPVLWLPHLRVPDPSVDRNSGFLIPSIRSDSNLGTGIEIPYFLTLGDHRDLTVTPYLASKAVSLGLRYRQAFSNGTLELNGAVSKDDTYDGLRAYLFAEGTWDIGRDFTFGLDLRTTSNIAYLADYGIYEGDDLPSTLTLTRYKADEAFDAELIFIRSLRDTQTAVSDTLPSIMAEVSYETIYEPVSLPGRLSFGLTASSSYRTSDTDMVGYDVLRIGGESHWDASTVFGPGVRLDGGASLYVDAYTQKDNSAYDSSVLRVTGAAETRLSWPLTRQTRTGASQILEPVMQLGWSRSEGGDIPNTDSGLVEFDEGNLLTLSRFPGADRRETGLTATAGLRFSHYGEETTYGLTFGRVLYLEDTLDYTAASGLSDTQSDWLIGASIRGDNGLSLSSRALLDDSASFTKWETRLDLDRDRYSVGTTYSYVIADAMEDRDTALNEFGIDSSIQLTPTWSADLDYLYDLAADETTRAGLGLTFQNDCARISLGLSRRFWDTDALDPTTRFSFSVGFGAYANETKSKSSCAF